MTVIYFNFTCFDYSTSTIKMYIFFPTCLLCNLANVVLKDLGNPTFFTGPV